MGKLFDRTFEIAALLISAALIAMLIQNAKGTVDVVQGVSGAFANLLRAATGGYRP